MESISGWVVAGGFVINVLVMVWSISRVQAKSEARFEQLVASERESRASQNYDTREFARAQAATAADRATAAFNKITEVELRMTQMFQNYPTKADMRDLFGEKLEPVTARLDTVYEELIRRGVQSTAIRPPFGDRP